MTVRAGGVVLLSIRTLRDEMAMSGQFQLAAGGQTSWPPTLNPPVLTIPPSSPYQDVRSSAAQV
jgi:hypothetical protein